MSNLNNQQVSHGSRPAAEPVFATVVHVCAERSFAFARDRNDRQIFLHFSQGRKTLERGRALWLSEDVEPRHPEVDDHLFLKVVPGTRSPRALYWGFAPTSHQDPTLYRKPWYEDVNLAELVGCQVVINRLDQDYQKVQEEMGVVNEIIIHDNKLTLSFLWRARCDRYTPNWQSYNRWRETFNLRFTDLRYKPFGQQQMNCCCNGTAVRKIMFYDPGSRRYIDSNRVVDLRLNPQFYHTNRAV